MYRLDLSSTDNLVECLASINKQNYLRLVTKMWYVENEKIREKMRKRYFHHVLPFFAHFLSISNLKHFNRIQCSEVL